jgi:quinol monooxygenase YgiN
MGLRRLGVCALCLLSAGAGAATSADPVRALTFIEVRADGIDRCRTLLSQASQKTPGAQHGLLLEEAARPERFVLLEDSGPVEGPAGPERRLEDLLDPLLVAPPDHRTHRELADTAVSGDDAGASASLYVITHLDLAPPERSKGEAALRELASAARQSAGNLKFEVWQQTDRTNHFNLISVWTDRAKFNAFVAGTAAREFRKSVASLLGSPYDERLYRRVDRWK